MNTRSFLLTTAAAFLIALGMAAPAAAQAPQYKIKLGSPTINDTVHHWMKLYKEAVEQRSGGRIQIDLFPASQLGSIPRQIEGVGFGTQEMLHIPPEFMSGLDKRLMVVSTPNLFQDLDHAFRTVRDPEFTRRLFSWAEPKGIKGLGIFCADPTSYVSLKPIKSAGDFSGRKIRIFASPMEIETMRQLGASGVPMSLGEVLPALQQGVVDGARTTVSIFNAFKFYGTAKHLVRTEEAYVCSMLIVNSAWLAKLPADLQAILADEALKADQATHTFALSFLDQNYRRWIENGGEIAVLSSADRASFNAKMAGVGDAVIKGNPEIKDALASLKTVADRQRR